jgi:hypothetical protein
MASQFTTTIAAAFCHHIKVYSITTIMTTCNCDYNCNLELCSVESNNVVRDGWQKSKNLPHKHAIAAYGAAMTGISS